MKKLFSAVAMAALLSAGALAVPAVSQASTLPSVITVNLQGSDVGQASGVTAQAAKAESEVGFANFGSTLDAKAFAVNNVASVTQDITGGALFGLNVQDSDLHQVSFVTADLASAESEVGGVNIAGNLTSEAIAGNNIASVAQTISNCGC